MDQGGDLDSGDVKGDRASNVIRMPVRAKAWEIEARIEALADIDRAIRLLSFSLKTLSHDEQGRRPPPA